MKSFKALLRGLTLILGLGSAAVAEAGIPTFDAANLAQAIIQVQSWTEQYKQMMEQIQSAKKQIENGDKTLKSLSGVRLMAKDILAQNPELREYLPKDYPTFLKNGVAKSKEYFENSKLFDIDLSRFKPESDQAKAFLAVAKQAALDRAANEEAYGKASERFTHIQGLLNKINDAPDPKDIEDLQARIAVEQVMTQNEAVKLQALQQLSLAQKDMMAQRSKEISMNSTRGGVPSTW